MKGHLGRHLDLDLYKSTSSQSPQGGLGWQNSFATQQFIELQGVRGPLGALGKIGVFGPFWLVLARVATELRLPT